MSDPRCRPDQPFGSHPRASAGTDPLAVAALAVSVLAVVGLWVGGIGGLLGPVGAALGQRARRNSAAGNGHGTGLATAAVIVGWVAFLLGVLIMGFLAWAFLKPDGLLNHA